MSHALEILTEACGRLPMTTRKMFGGCGFFAPNGGMFAGVLSDGQVILKLADGAARTELVAEGGHAWTYHGMKRPTTMHEWIVIPERFYDDHETFAAWVKRAHKLVPAKAAKKPATKQAVPKTAAPKRPPASKPPTKRAKRRS